MHTIKYLVIAALATFSLGGGTAMAEGDGDGNVIDYWGPKNVEAIYRQQASQKDVGDLLPTFRLKSTPAKDTQPPGLMGGGE